ncbi:M23 family metallopeptidase [Jeotgalibacillus terrae]|uniref:M23 family metallopeptidase n=1 Tax=Jeotgalibacillus terrae TaxID=587735 RepID=A0ABW5ZD15_9BACL|nr:M23 family metallopeptidase [Jeotgalibacillus terrae]MBM7577864.1 murein DD-endopeptidase MepM/ murein hydrolase activator NlpD [Jeotgalibacillus terrae]
MRQFIKYVLAAMLVFSTFAFFGESSKASASTFVTPVTQSNVITQYFTKNAHNGIDWSGGGLDSSIYATADGTVTHVDESNTSPYTGYGTIIRVAHEVNGQRYESFYSHLNSVDVREGQTVNQGERIGGMGNTGYTEGPTGIHLHFEMHEGYWAPQQLNPASARDPLALIGQDFGEPDEVDPILHSFDGSWATLRTVSNTGDDTINTYGSPGVGLNGTLAADRLVKVYEKASNGSVDYFRVQSNPDRWVHRDNGIVTPYIVKASFSTATYQEPAVNPERHPEGGLAPGDSYKTYGTEVTSDGQQWYNLGGKGWIKSDANGLYTYRMP